MRRPFQVYTFICVICGSPFNAKKCHAETCSDTCRSIKYRNKRLTGETKKISEKLKLVKSKCLSKNVTTNGEVSSTPVQNSSNNNAGNSEFQFEIYTTSYGSLVRFYNFERSLFSETVDRETIFDFERYLLKRNPFYFQLTKEDQEKVDCLKIILENRQTIIKNIWLCETGCNRFTSIVKKKERTISIPQFQYHY